VIEQKSFAANGDGLRLVALNNTMEHIKRMLRGGADDLAIDVQIHDMAIIGQAGCQAPFNFDPNKLALLSEVASVNSERWW
jgi:hypothetical protein